MILQKKKTGGEMLNGWIAASFSLGVLLPAAEINTTWDRAALLVKTDLLKHIIVTRRPTEEFSTYKPGENHQYIELHWSPSAHSPPQWAE